jgi:hypothetical protein
MSSDSEKFKIRTGVLCISFSLVFFFREWLGLSFGFMMLTLSLMKASAGWLFLRQKLWPAPRNEAAEEAED